MEAGIIILTAFQIFESNFIFSYILLFSSLRISFNYTSEYGKIYSFLDLDTTFVYSLNLYLGSSFNDTRLTLLIQWAVYLVPETARHFL